MHPVLSQLKNYPWSITEAPIVVLIVAQVIFPTPSCLFTCYLGHTSSSIIDMISGDSDTGPLSLILSISGIVVAVLFIIVLGVYTKREVDNLIEDEALEMFERGEIGVEDKKELELELESPRLGTIASMTSNALSAVEDDMANMAIVTDEGVV